jgi:hypothetical protein
MFGYWDVEAFDGFSIGSGDSGMGIVAHFIGFLLIESLIGRLVK